jgi:ribonucleotide reductase alpha subunit
MLEEMNVIKRDGTSQALDISKIHAVLDWACSGYGDGSLVAIKGVSVSDIEMRAQLQLHEGIRTKDIHGLLIKATESLISEDTPNYDWVAARLRWFAVRKEAFGSNTPPHLKAVIEQNIANKVYDPAIADMYTSEEWETINGFIDHTRDDLFRLAGAEQMAKKYLAQNRKTKKIYETFQFPYILVAAILFSQYPKATRLGYVKRYYDQISQHYISLPTPIMSGLRTRVKQFSSCTLISAGDSLNSINGAAAAIVEYASRKAGIGLNIGRLRAQGQPVRGGDAVTTGVLPFAKYFAAALKSCSQGAVRGASATFNWPVWHLEFETLIELKNNKGTEETRLRVVDYCVHLNETMYKRLAEDGVISFFSPEDVPGLYEAFYGPADKFEELYVQYENDPTKAKKQLPAKQVFSKLVKERFETGRVYIMNADHVNTHSSFNEPVEMTNLCLAGSTRIVSDQGLKTMEELYASQAHTEVSSDVRAFEGHEILPPVRTSKGTVWLGCGTRPCLASEIKLTGRSAPTIKVKTKSGYKLTLTPNHKVMTATGWKEAGDLKPLDAVYLQSGEGLWPERVALPTTTFVSDSLIGQGEQGSTPLNLPLEWTKELGEVVGWLTAGNCLQGLDAQPSLLFRLNEFSLIPKFEALLTRWMPQGDLSKRRISITTIQLHAQDARFATWLTRLGVTPSLAHEKTVPDSVFGANREAVVGFLRALFSADGMLAVSRDTLSISLSSTSKTLLEGTQLLLLNLGIRSSISANQKPTHSESGCKPKEDAVRQVFSLEIGEGSLSRFMNEIGFLQSYKTERVAAAVASRKTPGATLRTGPYAERFMDEVVAIEDAGEQTVYDITVEDSHSLIANGIAVHNCTEITLPTTPMAQEDSRIALCTLSGLNWGKISSEEQMAEASEMSVRALDALLDYQDYPNIAAHRATLQYRPLGIGVIGFAHWLAKHYLVWGKPDTLEAVSRQMESMAWHLTKASIELAKERGACQSRTRYHDGIFPIDTARGEVTTEKDWDSLRVLAKQYGIRNATLMAFMPSETSSQLANETNGFEPPRSLISTKGSKDVTSTQVVPEYNKLAHSYETLWNVSVKDYLSTVAVLQQFIDQAMSVNTSYNPANYPDGITTSELTRDLILAWKLGVKTLYYCNTLDDAEDAPEAGCGSGGCTL